MQLSDGWCTWASGEVTWAILLVIIALGSGKAGVAGWNGVILEQATGVGVQGRIGEYGGKVGNWDRLFVFLLSTIV